MRELQEFGRRLKGARQAKGLTQIQFARELGFGTNSAVVHWEKGERTFPLEKISDACRILRVDANYLFGVSAVRYTPAPQQIPDNPNPACNDRSATGVPCVRSKEHAGIHWDGRNLKWARGGSF